MTTGTIELKTIEIKTYDDMITIPDVLTYFLGESEFDYTVIITKECTHNILNSRIETLRVYHNQ